MALPDPPPPTRGPIRVAPSRRRLLDADGQPVLIQGDAAWSLIANTTLEEAKRYIDDRRRKGFNALIVNLIEYLFANDAPRNRAGDEPFSTPGDFRTPNEPYFEHAERVLEHASDAGLLVLLAPTYLGYPDPSYPGYRGRNEGWYDEILANGPAGCRAWGDYLGRRFGRFGNLIWVIGGDRNPDQALPALEAVAGALRAAGITNPMTASVFPGSSPVDVYPGQTWMDLNATYTYDIVHRSLLHDWARDPIYPFFLLESTYENEHDASLLQLRRQAYWSVLCGGNGHCMGNKPIWMFGEGWESALSEPGSIAMAQFGAFFRGLAWHRLEPDVQRRVLIAGLGEERGLDRATAAMSTDGRLAVVYTPTRRPLSIDAGALTGPSLNVEWFDPATGRRASGGTLTARGLCMLTPPFEEDAALVLTTLGSPQTSDEW